MPKAILTLDDQGEEMTMTLFYEGGFTLSSNAHQMANLLVKHMDSLGMKSHEDTKWVSAEEAQALAGPTLQPGIPDAGNRIITLPH